MHIALGDIAPLNRRTTLMAVMSKPFRKPSLVPKTTELTERPFDEVDEALA
ncbi:hypothetical protein SAMN05443247_00277 [Bradyrhizobium erythrophlei]|nr:hypothetical protein SAMN05443247_00277 [Bradyrhizobium erythrophlei]